MATWPTHDGEHPPTGSLRRRIQPVDDAVQVDYEVAGPPGSVLCTPSMRCWTSAPPRV